MTSVTILGIALTLGAPGPKDAPPKNPDQSIVGDWVGVDIRAGDLVLKNEDQFFTFTADGKVRYRAGRAAEKEYPYTVDPAKDPAEVNWTSPGQKPVAGIYKVEKDTLVICYAAKPGGKRPTKFESAVGSQNVLMTLTRVEK
jgi:uncharacterized protein (TIGR03067 family)